MNKQFFNDYFENKVFKEEFGDKEIVYDEFSDFVNKLNLPDKIRLACYNKYMSSKDICNLDPDKSEQYILVAISRLKLDLNIKKENGLNYYITNKKGLNHLFLTISKFIADSKYIQTQLNKDGNKINYFDSKEIIKLYYNFFSTYYDVQIRKAINEDAKFLDVDCSEIFQYDFKLGDVLEQNAIESISIMEEVLKSFCSIGDNHVKVRLFNLPNYFLKKIGHHRSQDLNKLVQFEGIIKRKTDVNPILKYLHYICSNPDCVFSGTKNKIIVPQFEEKARVLKSCPKCKSGVEMIDKVLLDSMFMLLEEDYSNSPEDSKLKTVNLSVQGELVQPILESQYKPGQKVKVIGILREKPILTKGGVKSVNYHTMLDVNNIICDDNSINFVITKEEEKKIIELGKNKDVFKLLLSNFIPEIKGYKNIKSSMLLQLVGAGIENKNQRSDSHILIVGDPGVAKTKLATYYLDYAPKAVYSSGTNTSKAGLTGACIKDEFTGDWAIEAGVLPKANNGIAVIDELDKMSPEDSQVMHDALETQIIPIRKAISVDLVCKCGVLAIANPRYSSFDDHTDIIKQINLPGSLLNRFDLIYILKDKYDKKKDSEICEHIIKSWNDEEVNFNEPEFKLEKEFIRKYIYFCKNNIFPKISEEASKIFMKTNNDLRLRTQDTLFKFNPRQLNGIIRLAISYAKLTFKPKVDKESANFAVGLYIDFLEKFGFDNLNSIVASEFDLTYRKILDYLTQVREATIDNIYENFKDIKPEEIDKEIKKLKSQGLIFEPRKETLKPLM